jgi:hypothetical protein
MKVKRLARMIVWAVLITIAVIAVYVIFNATTGF